MKKSKLIIIGAAILLTGLSSCGIFKKGCGCPTFGAVKGAGGKGCADMQISDVQMFDVVPFC